MMYLLLIEHEKKNLADPLIIVIYVKIIEKFQFLYNKCVLDSIKIFNNQN